MISTSRSAEAAVTRTDLSRNAGRDHLGMEGDSHSGIMTTWPGIGDLLPQSVSSGSRVGPRSPAQSRRRVPILVVQNDGALVGNTVFAFARRISLPWSVRSRVSNGAWLSFLGAIYPARKILMSVSVTSMASAACSMAPAPCSLAPELGHGAPMMVNGRLTSAPAGIVAAILDLHAAQYVVDDFQVHATCR